MQVTWYLYMELLILLIKCGFYLHHYRIPIHAINVFSFLESAEELLHWFLRSQGCTVHCIAGIPIYTSILLHTCIYTFKKWEIISGEKIFLGKPWYWGATLSPLSKSEIFLLLYRHVKSINWGICALISLHTSSTKAYKNVYDIWK